MKTINVGLNDGSKGVFVFTMDLPPEFTELIRHMQDAHECEYTWPELAEQLNRLIIGKINGTW